MCLCLWVCASLCLSLSVSLSASPLVAELQLLSVCVSGYFLTPPCLDCLASPPQTLDIFVLLVATLVHDVDHNGLNNSFHINSQSPLAVLYNDISVLENHHCSFANKLLARTENNIFANMEPEEQQRARSRMIRCVLSTDMSTHFDVTNKFKLLVDSKQFTKGVLHSARLPACQLCQASWRQFNWLKLLAAALCCCR